MKRIVATSAILALFAGAVSASAERANEAPGAPPVPFASEHITQVKAGELYFNKEMTRMGLKADDLVNVTYFPTSGMIDPPSRDG